MVTEAPVVSISEAAASLGVSVRTLRYYEEVGLLEAARRGAGGVRYYSETSVQRVQRIIDLRNLAGFSLDEVKAYLDAEAQLDVLRTSFGRGSAVEKRQLLDRAEELLRGELAVVEAKMAGLQVLRQQIQERLQRAHNLCRNLEN